MSVAVVTDSASSLPDGLVAKHAIGVVPIHVRIGETELRDGELSLDDVVARLGEGVSTSAPSPGAFATVIEESLGRADEVLVLTVASSMSTTYNTAVLGAEAAGGRVRVVDTRTAAGAQALVVLEAARAAQRGASLDEVEAAALRVVERVRLVATVESLDHLVRSGRVPNIAGVAGRYLGVNPLFEFVDGKARPLRPAFSREAALDRIAAACRGRGDHRGERLHVAALHASDAETAQRLLTAVSEDEDPVEAFVGSFSPGMVAHTGPGLAGLAWWRERRDAPDTT